MSLSEVMCPWNPIWEPRGIVLSLEEHYDLMGVLDDSPIVTFSNYLSLYFSNGLKTIAFMHIWSQNIYGKSLHLPLSFAMSLKML